VGELSDRRARKKARTRAEIRRTAQELFAERGFDAVTIADIAATADVAVQTVFNHFPTKEALFFADRTPWVEGPADAVRTREPGVGPLTALRTYTMRHFVGVVAASTTPERRQVVELVRASSSLCAFERELVHRSEERLAAALADAWRDPAPGGADPADDDRDPAPPCPHVRIAASLTAALWCSAASTLTFELRDVQDPDADAAAIQHAVETLADRVFARLETSLGTLLQLPGSAAQEPSQPAPRAG
jgi:AcrR family transcriptional regulator